MAQMMGLMEMMKMMKLNCEKNLWMFWLNRGLIIFDNFLLLFKKNYNLTLYNHRTNLQGKCGKRVKMKMYII